MLNPVLGLDPAGPLFSHDFINLFNMERSLPSRLDPSDAQYVQCMRTSLLGFNIINFACGHANFIMYDGLRQPQCHTRMNILCNHIAARKYFQRTLNPKINRLIGSARVTDKIAEGICRCRTGERIIAAKLPQLVYYKTERLGIHNYRNSGTFYIDDNKRNIDETIME